MPRPDGEPLTVNELVSHLRFGEWVIQVGMIKRRHAADSRNAVKRVFLQRAWIADGCLFVESRLDAKRSTYHEDSWPLEDLVVLKSGRMGAPIYTLRGNVTVHVGSGEARREAKRDRALAAFQRGIRSRRRAKKSRGKKRAPTMRSVA